MRSLPPSRICSHPCQGVEAHESGKLWECLARKKELLAKIQANTQTQLRFVYRREMRGLERLLRERQKLIMELATVNLELDGDNGWKKAAEFQPWLKEFANKQQVILECNKQVVQAAMIEKSKIAAMLQNIRKQRNARKCYLGSQGMGVGYRINRKG